MSMKPEDIPQWAWHKAESAFWNDQSCTFNASGFSDDVVSVMARAIMAAVEEENRTCEALADKEADEARRNHCEPQSLGASWVAKSIRDRRQSKDG